MDDNQPFTDLEWLEASRANLLKISKRQQAELSDARATIAAQAEALEGYRLMMHKLDDQIPHSVVVFSLPQHELNVLHDRNAELRKRGVEVGEVEGGDEV